MQFIARSRRRKDWYLPNTVRCGRLLWHTACRVHWKTICVKTKEQLYQSESGRPRCFSEQIRNVDYNIYQDKKQDHLGKHKAMHRTSAKPQQFNSRMNKDNVQLPSWSRSSNHISTKNNFFKIGVWRRRSTGSVKHRKNCGKIVPDRDLRTLWEFYETSRLRLQLLHRNREYLLQLWTKFEDFAVCHSISKGQLRFQFDLWPHHKEEFQSRTKA